MPPPITKVLMFAAEPSGTGSVRLGEEFREIDDCRWKIDHDNQFDVIHRPAARPLDLQQQIDRFKPGFVHFSGHGTGPRGLALENEQGQVQLVPTGALADLFRLFEGRVQCVIMNACLSAEQAEEIVRYVPYVIGMRQEIGDAAAIQFAIGFYGALFGGKSVEEAFQFGCTAIRLQDQSGDPATRHAGAGGAAGPALAEHQKPVLLVRPDVFVCSRDEDDKWVETTLVARLAAAGVRRVAGDWLARRPDGIAGGRRVAVRASRSVLAVLTPEWCAAAAAGDPEGALDGKARPLRGLRLKDCTPPPGFDAASVFDCRDAAQLEAAFERLVRELAPATPAPVAEPPDTERLAERAKTAFDTLGELMEQADDVRDAVGRVADKLGSAQSDLAELDRWKQLHERMHRLADTFPALTEKFDDLKEAAKALDELRAVTTAADDPSLVEQQAAVDQVWDKINVVLTKQILPPLKVLTRFAGPPVFRVEEVLWVTDFALAQQKLEKCYPDQDTKALRRGVELIRAQLPQQMPAVDKQLFDTAGRVPLKQMGDHLQAVGEQVSRLPLGPDLAVRIATFRRNVDAIRQLDRRLKDLIDNHRVLQQIDSRVRGMDGSDVATDEIVETWAELKSTFERLRVGSQDDWLAALDRTRQAVDARVAAAAAADPRAARQVRSAFNTFLSELIVAFQQADTTLVGFCRDLRVVRESLDRVLPPAAPATP